MNNPLTPDEIKELRVVIGKAVGCVGPYTWGIEDYVPVAEHFKAKGLAEAESKVKAREREIVEWATDEANHCGCVECAMWVERLKLTFSLG